MSTDMKLILSSDEKKAILKAAIETVAADRVTQKEEIKFLTNIAVSLNINTEEMIGAFLYNEQDLRTVINNMSKDKRFIMLDIIIHAVVADSEISLDEVLVTKKFEDLLEVTVEQMNGNNLMYSRSLN